MILRQVTVRHGRSAIASSIRCNRQTYATSVTDLPAFTPSTNDRQPNATIPGHPDEPSSILDQSHLPPTRASREAADRLASIIHDASSIQGEFNSFLAAKEQHTQGRDVSVQVTSEQPLINSKKNGQRLDAFYNSRRQQKKLSQLGSKLVNIYEPWGIVRDPPKPHDVTLPMLLANQTHLGHATSLWHPSNSSYIFGIREGIHIISLEITLAHLRRATKVVREVARRGGLILFVGTRKGHREIVVNAAKLADGYHNFDRWIPGTLTNAQQVLGGKAVKIVDQNDQEIKKYEEVLKEPEHPVLKPDLVICLNPLENEVCLHECGIHGVPTIGVIDTDTNPSRVTYPIPANDDSLRSIALIAGTLGRAAQEGQQLRKDAVKNGEMPVDDTEVRNFLRQVSDLTNINLDALGDKDKDVSKGAER